MQAIAGAQGPRDVLRQRRSEPETQRRARDDEPDDRRPQPRPAQHEAHHGDRQQPGDEAEVRRAFDQSDVIMKEVFAAPVSSSATVTPTL